MLDPCQQTMKLLTNHSEQPLGFLWGPQRRVTAPRRATPTTNNHTQVRNGPARERAQGPPMQRSKSNHHPIEERLL